MNGKESLEERLIADIGGAVDLHWTDTVQDAALEVDKKIVDDYLTSPVSDAATHLAEHIYQKLAVEQITHGVLIGVVDGYAVVRTDILKALGGISAEIVPIGCIQKVRYYGK